MESLTAIYCHGNSAEHGAVFLDQLRKENYQFQVLAAPAAVQKFQDKQIPFVEFTDQSGNSCQKKLAEALAAKCANSKVVLADLGHSITQQVFEILKEQFPHIMRTVYYDNPEAYVHGGWSEEASKTMALAHRVLFSNANLASEPIFREVGHEFPLDYKKRSGIGYHPVQDAERVETRRKVERESLRMQVFDNGDLLGHQKLEDAGQKLFVYFGANNDDYFHHAFPAFLDYLDQTLEQGADFSNTVILMHQHPGVKFSPRRDYSLDLLGLKAWLHKRAENPKIPTFILSQLSFENAQVVADGILYYQTSAAPKFILAGIPTARVAHSEERYHDMVVSSWLGPDVRAGRLLKNFLQNPDSFKATCNKEEMREKLGIRSDWFEIFKKAIEPLERKQGWFNFTCCGKACVSTKRSVQIKKPDAGRIGRQN